MPSLFGHDADLHAEIGVGAAMKVLNEGGPAPVVGQHASFEGLEIAGLHRDVDLAPVDRIGGDAIADDELVVGGPARVETGQHDQGAVGGEAAFAVDEGVLVKPGRLEVPVLVGQIGQPDSVQPNETVDRSMDRHVRFAPRPSSLGGGTESPPNRPGTGRFKAHGSRQGKSRIGARCGNRPTRLEIRPTTGRSRRDWLARARTWPASARSAPIRGHTDFEAQGGADSNSVHGGARLMLATRSPTIRASFVP